MLTMVVQLHIGEGDLRELRALWRGLRYVLGLVALLFALVAGAFARLLMTTFDNHTWRLLP